MTVKEIINSLIEISQIKYGLLKVGKDTLHQDILFIEKYEQLKNELMVDGMDQVDFKAYPEMLQLKIMIEEIDRFEQNQSPQNKRLNQAIKAYKK